MCCALKIVNVSSWGSQLWSKLFESKLWKVVIVSQSPTIQQTDERENPKMVGALVYFYFFLLSAWRGGGEHFPFSFPNSSSVLFFQVQVQPSTTVRSSVLLLRWWWWWWGRIFQQVATLSLSLSLHGVCLFFLFYTLYLSFLLDTTTKGKTTMRNHYPRGKRKYLLTFLFLLLLTRAEANDRTYPLHFGREEGRLLFFF